MCCDCLNRHFADLQVFDIYRKCVLKQIVEAGKQQVSPALPAGVYLLLLEWPGQASGLIHWMKTQ